MRTRMRMRMKMKGGLEDRNSAYRWNVQRRVLEGQKEEVKSRDVDRQI